MADLNATETINAIRQTIDAVEYKPETGFFLYDKGDCYFISHWQMLMDSDAFFARPTSDSIPPKVLQEGRKWYIEDPLDQDSVWKTMHHAVRRFEEHEANEWFTVNGEVVRSPHERWDDNL